MITKGESLAPRTTLKVGGAAEYFVTVSSKDELVSIADAVKREGWAVHILGGGSNVLVSDEGVPGLTIKNELKGKTQVTQGDVIELTVASGEVLDDIVAMTVAEGWWGLENLSHIPGSVGATPVQNVGAYGVEVKDIIKGVEVFDIHTRSFKTLSNAECHFAYRHSIFKTEEGKGYFVTAVTFNLSTTPTPVIGYNDLKAHFANKVPTQTEIREAIIEIRSKKFPDWHVVGTAGSFFKNPVVPRTVYESLLKQYPDMPGFAVGEQDVKLPLGWIFDRILKVRGVREGNVGTYEGQALVLVADAKATASEIRSFAHSLEAKVHDALGIPIEWEVTKW